MPQNWQPGDFPLSHPNSTSPNWPIEEMKKDKNGTWSYTIPLPTGVFSYQFYVNASEDLSKAVPVSDPNNKPWNENTGKVVGSKQLSSQVYVPYDAVYQYEDNRFMAPASKKGTLESITYDTARLKDGKNYLVVYTPYGYDNSRTKPYPTLYLSHGGGGNETDWTTQGVAQNIIDNLIAAGKIEPMVVVMPNLGVYPADNFREDLDLDVIEQIIPLIERRYNVSHLVEDRAFAGLSMGGMITDSFVIKHTDAFKYYGVMSAGLPPDITVITKEQGLALKGKAVMIAVGWQDPIMAMGFGKIQTGPMKEIQMLTQAGVTIVPDFINGGHNWATWRLLLIDFLTKTAFRPLPYPDWTF